MPVKSRAIFAFIYLIFILVHQTNALSCGKCRAEECEIKECKFGTTKDACNCCDICAKGPGEECGGPWGLGGRCAQNFTCTFSKLPEGVNFYFFRTGLCLPDNISPEENLTH